MKSFDAIQLKVSDVASRLGVHNEFLKNLKKTGKINYKALEPSHGVQISLEELMKMLTYCALKDVFHPEMIERLISLGERGRIKSNTGGGDE